MCVGRGSTISDIRYSVEVSFLTSGGFDKPGAGIDKLQNKTEKWTKSLFGGVSGFASSFNGVLDTIGSKVLDVGFSAAKGLSAAAGIGLVAATKAAFDFNEQMENSTISLAAIANANGVADGIGNGMRLAGDTLKEMRKDARELPGEFKDLVNIMTTISSATSQAGMGMPGTEKLAAKTMAAAAVLSIPQNVAGREMAMLLEGNARHQMPLFNRLGMGIGTKEFNALDPKKRLEMVTQALDRLNPAVDVFKNSWEGLKTTTVDNIRQGMGLVAGPLFTSVKEQMQRFNSWVSDDGNKDKLSRFGETLGASLDKAFNDSIHSIEHWFPIVSTFARHLHEQLSAVWNKMGPMVHAAFGKLEKFLVDPEAITKLGNVAKTFAEMRVGGAALQAGGSLLNSGAGEAAIEALGVGGAAVALIGLAVAAEGAAHAVLDSSSAFHGVAVSQVAQIGESAGKTMGYLEKIGSNLQPVADALGVGLLWGVKQVTTAFETCSWAILKLQEASYGFANWVNDNLLHIGKDPRLTNDPDADPNGTLHPSYDLPYGGIAVKDFNAFAHLEKDRKIPQITNHFHGNIQIQVNSNQDPNRIAKRTADVLADLARHPKVATQSGAPVLSR